MTTPTRRIVPGHGEGVGQLEERLGPEGVADLGAVDGQLGHAVGHLETDVPVGAPALPLRQGLGPEPLHRVHRGPGDDGIRARLRCRLLAVGSFALQPFDQSLLESLLVRSPRLPACRSW